MLPAHLRSAVQTGHLAEDSSEAARVWDKVRSRYAGHDWVFEKFAEGFGLLLEGASLPDGVPTYQDIVGEVYTAWGRPSRSTGQFFTPWPVARFMAEMLGDSGQEVHAPPSCAGRHCARVATTSHARPMAIATAEPTTTRAKHDNITRASMGGALARSGACAGWAALVTNAQSFVPVYLLATIDEIDDRRSLGL